MKNYQDIAYGLKQVFLVELMQTLCEFLPPIVFLAGWIFASDWLIDSLYFLYFGRILFPAICGVSLYGMRKEIGTCKKAAALCFVNAAALVIRFIVHADRIHDASYIMYFGAEEGMSMYDEYFIYDSVVFTEANSHRREQARTFRGICFIFKIFTCELSSFRCTG